MTGHSLFMDGPRTLEVEHLSTFHHGRLCIFTVTQAGVSQMYLTHLDDNPTSTTELHVELMRRVKTRQHGTMKLGPAFRKVKDGQAQ